MGAHSTLLPGQVDAGLGGGTVTNEEEDVPQPPLLPALPLCQQECH